MVRRREVRVVSIWSEEHEFYGHHYHIETAPSFPPKRLMECLMRIAEKHLPKTRYRLHRDEKQDEMKFQVRKLEETGYTTSLFLVTYQKSVKHFNIRLGEWKKHHKVHVHFESESGKRLFKDLIRACFPKAAIQTHE